MTSISHFIKIGYVPLVPGDVVRMHDVMRIHESAVTMDPCKYDKMGHKCCVGQVIDENNRFWRPTDLILHGGGFLH